MSINEIWIHIYMNGIMLLACVSNVAFDLMCTTSLFPNMNTCLQAQTKYYGMLQVQAVRPMSGMLGS